jgi:hypothetical protein
MALRARFLVKAAGVFYPATKSTKSGVLLVIRKLHQFTTTLIHHSRDDITCERSIKANTATTVVGITLGPSGSESDTIELHACWVCQVEGISDNCGAKKLWILADGAIRRVSLGLVAITHD